MNYTLDTNIMIYLLDGKLADSLPDGRFYTSIISKLELFSFADLTTEKLERIQNFLNITQLIHLTDTICDQTIALRCRYKLKLPDAIIAATAIVQDSILLTNDSRLNRVSELTVRPLSLRY
jgi:predicted nucleic acid-binding protein